MMTTLMVPSCERRTAALPAARAGLRADGHGETFTGATVPFGRRAAIGNPLTWGFYEEIAPGAATKTLAEGDQRFLVDHDPSKIVARVSAGTLRLAAMPEHVAVEADLNPAKTYVGDLIENLRDGSVTGMSWGFQVIKERWSTETVDAADGATAEVEVRRVLEMRIHEVSAVTFPAYEVGTAAGLRGEAADVAAALLARGDRAAIERRAALRPELAALIELCEPPDGTRATEEPGEPTPPPAAPPACLVLLRERLDHALAEPLG